MINNSFNIAEEYDTVLAGNRGLRCSWHYMKFNSVKTAFPQQSDKVLDIGCGPGVFLDICSDIFSKAVGIDSSELMISYAKKKHNNSKIIFKWVSGSEYYPFSEQSFDVITMIEVIEHLELCEQKKVFDEVKRLLKPGGIFILTTPNYRGWWPMMEVLLSKIGSIDYTEDHINHFDCKILRKMLLDQEFEVVDLKGVIGIISFISGIFSKKLAYKICLLESKILPKFSQALLCAVCRKRR